MLGLLSKGTLNQFYPRILFRPLDAHDIVAIVYIMKFIMISILPGDAADLSPLMMINGFRWASVILTSSKLYFNEGQDLVVPSNQIDLTRRPAILSSHDMVPVFPQEMVGEHFSRITLFQVG
jgi:hypothetical protein